MDEPELTPAERAWVASRLRQLRERDSWLMGTYAEHVVADALVGAQASASSFAAWDLDWNDVSIEVKCSTERQTGVTEADKPSPAKWTVPPHYAWNHEAGDWHPGEKTRWAKVYVLARHEGFDHLSGWTFYVVPCWWLDARTSVSVTGASVRSAGWGPHDRAGVPEAVRAAAASSPPDEH